MTDAPRDDANVTYIGARLAEAVPVRLGRKDGLSEKCPVFALGMGPATFTLLDTKQNIVTVPLGRLSGSVIRGLFANYYPFLLEEWPRRSAKGKVLGFDNNLAAVALEAACHQMGFYNGTQRIIRGRGVHPGADGDVVVNLGNTLWVRGQLERLGAREDGYIYPRGNVLGEPHAKPQAAGADGPAAAILDILRAWSWTDPIYPRLLLGWLAMAMVGGAVEWRAHCWINAPHGSGKSTLLHFLSAIMDDLAHESADATPAAIRARLGNDAIAFILDETEAKADDTRITNLVELARLSSSGAHADRSTSDHGSITFTLRTALLMASIARPPMRSQDQSRFSVLKMTRATGGRPPAFQPEKLRVLGRQLFRRMLDRFRDLPAVYDAWQDSLRGAGVKDGHDPQQYGILLACADLALEADITSDEERAALAAAVAEVTQDARAEQMLEWQRVLQRIATSTITRGTEQVAISALIERAARRCCIEDPETGKITRPTIETAMENNRRLMALGLRFVPIEDADGRPLRTWEGDPTKPPAHNGDGDYIGWLAVANAHEGLNNAVFRHSHWAARSGTSGGWKAALMEAPLAEARKPMKFAGLVSRCVMVDVNLVLDQGGVE